MKKLFSYLIATILVAGLGVGVFFIILNIVNKQELTLTVEAGENGSVIATIDNNRYKVDSNFSKNFKVTRKSKVSLKATPAEKYSVLSWQENGLEFSAEPEITINVKKNIKYSVSFQANSVDLTIVDAEGFNQNVKFKLSENLYNTLNSLYTAEAGYKYIYKIGNTEVTQNTTITDSTTITREVSEITYTVIYKNGTEIVSTQTYSKTNQNLTAPSLEVEHYDVTWSNFEYTFPATETTFTISAILKATDYKVTFIHNGKEIKVNGEDTYYNIDNTKITPPEITLENKKVVWEINIPANYGPITVDSKIVATHSVNYVVTDGSTDNLKNTYQSLSYYNNKIYVDNTKIDFDAFAAELFSNSKTGETQTLQIEKINDTEITELSQFKDSLKLLLESTENLEITLTYKLITLPVHTINYSIAEPGYDVDYIDYLYFSISYCNNIVYALNGSKIIETTEFNTVAELLYNNTYDNDPDTVLTVVSINGTEIDNLEWFKEALKDILESSTAQTIEIVYE